MKPKNFVALFVVFFFILSFSAPAFSFSGNMRYDKYYDLDGKMLLKIQTGDAASSPAQQKTLVEGRGAFERYESIFLSPASIRVKSDSDWEVDESHLRGLSVGSAIKLNQDQVYLLDGMGDQVFAVKVDSDPGEEGHLSQDWSASDQVYSEEVSSMFVIDQDAYTTGGKMKRYIDLICPASGVYLFEDSEIVGYARVIDSLQPEGSANSNNSETDEDEGSLLESNSGQEEGSFTTSTDVEPAEDNFKDQVYVLESDDFETTVPLGTPIEEIELNQSISLTTEMIQISGIEIDWDSQTIPEYDPYQSGSYIFTGQLIFPDYIIAPEKIFIFYTVHVVDDQGSQE